MIDTDNINSELRNTARKLKMHKKRLSELDTERKITQTFIKRLESELADLRLSKAIGGISKGDYFIDYKNDYGIYMGHNGLSNPPFGKMLFKPHEGYVYPARKATIDEIENAREKIKEQQLKERKQKMGDNNKSMENGSLSAKGKDQHGILIKGR